MMKNYCDKKECGIQLEYPSLNNIGKNNRARRISLKYYEDGSQFRMLSFCEKHFQEFLKKIFDEVVPQ